MTDQSENQAKQDDQDGFYRVFEDRFRGSRELIRTRLEAYRPFLELLRTLEARPNAVDLGCGRGEWLELLTENGFAATGVDLDEGMLAACRERRLDVVNADVVKYLEKLGDQTQAIVSGFHIAEHLPFPTLQALVRQAHRVLQPGGLLILETPNPEVPSVSLLTFYIDPTHIHPLPPPLLSFLPEYYGFGRFRVIRLQEDPEVRDSAFASLSDVFSGASRDYAVVAQKGGEDRLIAPFDNLFDASFGVETDELIRRFDAREGERDLELQGLGARLDSERDQIEREVASAEKRLEQKLAETKEIIQGKLAETERLLTGKLAERDAELLNVYSSRSWRMTRPLRKFDKRWRKLSRLLSRPRQSIDDALIRYCRRPHRKARLLGLIRPLPPLRRRLLRILGDD